MGIRDSEFATPSPMELETQREIQPSEEVVSPRELLAPVIEKQVPVELVLVLTIERPEPTAPSVKSEGVTMKRLALDEEAPQRAAEKDKTLSDEAPADFKYEDYESFRDASVSELENLVKRLGGMVISMEYTKEGDHLSNITIEIPGEKINEFMDGLKELGEIDRKTEEIPFEEDKVLFSIELPNNG